MMEDRTASEVAPCCSCFGRIPTKICFQSKYFMPYGTLRYLPSALKQCIGIPVLTLPELGFGLRMTPVWSEGDEKDRSDNGLLGILGKI